MDGPFLFELFEWMMRAPISGIAPNALLAHQYACARQRLEPCANVIADYRL